MKTLKKMWAYLNKKHGDNENDLKWLRRTNVVIAVLVMSNLVATIVGYWFDHDYSGVGGYVVALMWCAMYFFFNWANDKLLKNYRELVKASDKMVNSALDGWKDSVEIANEEHQYARFLEGKLGLDGVALREEYANTLSTTQMGKPLE
jgi:hypothetical protein